MVTVGADGRIRKFNVLTLDEASETSSEPVLAARLAQIDSSCGYRFSQAEVGAPHRLVFSGIEDARAVVQLLGDIELHLRAGFAIARSKLVCQSVCRPVTASNCEIEGLFNPLLFLSGMKPIPCNLRFDSATSMLLVTGPNSGGKTRLLQSIGLTQLLAQNGLFVPAARASIAMVSGLVASLIEGTKADQAEGRLGMEMMRIRELFERLPPNAMVLLDELCSGTNPSEGEHIVELVLRVLHRLRPQAFITTHFLAFARRLNTAGSVPGLGFLQVALGPDKRPLYQFERGVADSRSRRRRRRLGHRRPAARSGGAESAPLAGATVAAADGYVPQRRRCRRLRASSGGTRQAGRPPPALAARCHNSRVAGAIVFAGVSVARARSARTGLERRRRVAIATTNRRTLTLRAWSRRARCCSASRDRTRATGQRPR
jgi:DNA mismatch repair protein MutS2